MYTNTVQCIVLSTLGVCVEYVCVCWLGHLDVWGELASRKRSLTHHPSSQGWASRCLVIVCLCVYLSGCRYSCDLFGMWVWLAYSSFYIIQLV